jgi:hypothetical protein
MLRMHIRTAWSDYFTGNSTLIQQKDYGTTQTPSGTSVYVLNCLFRSITSTSNGGALSCSNSVTYLLVESSSFYSCKTSSGYGGAIYFINSNGQCVMYEVCGNNCSSSNGVFSRVDVNNAATSKNCVNYSSISRCAVSSSLNTLCHQYGKILCTSVNTSMNKCGGRIGIYCNPYGDSNSVTCSLSHSTFADNYANGCTCICYGSNTPKYEINSCNILRNTQTSLNSEGTVSIWGITNIVDSCFLENNATYIFYASSSSFTVTLSNCTVDSNSFSGNIVTKNTVTKSFIHALNHISTQNCNSEYDSVGQTLSSSKNKINGCTCGNYIVLLRRRDIISLISILIFNFIHPYTSIDPFY